MDSELSFTGKRWVIAEESNISDDIVARLQKERALEPCSMPSPAQFADMPRAVERIVDACARRERIGIFGDYDCDGVTACAQLVRMLRRRGCDPIVRLPHRVRDGYGIKPQHIEEFADAGVSLLLAADTGITANEALARATARGIASIIIDHHVLRGEPPPADAILHPSRCSPPLDAAPCAAGIAFLLVAAMENTDRWEGQEEELALAMIGTVADCVELRGMNRALVQRGLAAIPFLPEGPLASLLRQCGVQEEASISRLASARSGSTLAGARVTSRDIAFRVAPRINAAGRMDDPHIALTALLEGGIAIAALERCNTERQRVTQSLLDDIFASDSLVSTSPFVLLASAQYHHGIVGLLAGKIVDRTGHPALVGTIRGEQCTASLRSIPGYDITAALQRVAPLLSSFGGHAQAAGCSFPAAHIADLHRALIADVLATVPAEHLHPSLFFDSCLHPAAITRDLCTRIRELEPFGQGNPEPRFLLHNVRLRAPCSMGREGKHLTASIDGQRAVGFGLGHLLLHCDQPLDIACRIGINEWNGRSTPQIVVEDVRVARPAAVPAY